MPPRSSALIHAARGGPSAWRAAAAQVVLQFNGRIAAALHHEKVARSIPCGVEEGEVFKMAIEPEGWHMDPGPPSWDPEAKRFSFFLHKRGHERVLCFVAMDALENAVQSEDLSEPGLTRIFDAHRLMIELRAAQKLNAGLLEADGSVLVSANDI